MKNKKDYRLCGQHRNASDDNCTDLKRHPFFEEDLKPAHMPTPWIKSVNGEPTRTLDEVAFYAGPNAAFIVKAVNCHEELLEAAKNARNVLAALVTGDLKEIKTDSAALLALRLAIAKAETR